MNLKNRELEKKFEVLTPTYTELSGKLVNFYHVEKKVPAKRVLVDCGTIDRYWEVPGRANFVRIRNSAGKWLSGAPQILREVTVKEKDQGDNLDRMEINGDIKSVQKFQQIFNAALGPSLGAVKKEEVVVFLENGVVVSLSLSLQDGKVYLEVEGPELEGIEAELRRLRPLCTWKREPRSLFEIYVKDSQ